MPDEQNTSSNLDLSVVIVNWNTCNDLRNCLSSLYRYLRSVEFEAIVCDNASEDTSTAMVRDEFPQAILIQNPSNLGFSAANNVAIRRASGRHVLLLNPDCLFTEDCVTPLVIELDSDSRIGLIACQLRNSDDTCQQSADLFPFPFQEVNPQFRARRNAFFKKLEIVIGSKARCEAGVLVGAFHIIPRQLLLNVGLLDSNLFMYGEDLDLCYRIRAAKKRIIFDASHSIIHLGGKSSSQIWNNLDRLKRVRQSIFLIHVKHFGPGVSIAALVVRTILGWVRYLFAMPRPSEIRSAYAAEANANFETLMKAPALIRGVNAPIS